MIKTGIEDIRKLVFPYFYEDISFSNEEISKGIKYKYIPITKKGIEIKNAIIENAIKYKDKESPLEIKVWEGTIKNKNIEVYIWERDEGVKLLGPAALNKVWIKEGSILGLSPNKKMDNAVDTGKTYLEGIASEMAYNIEIMLDQNKKSFEHRMKICYRASEVNLELDDIFLEYIHSNQKKVDIRGPVFVGLSYKVID